MVQPLGPLMRQALRYSALHAAWKKVEDNRGMAGADGETIDDLASRIAGCLQQLTQEVISGQYRPQPLLRVWVPRPGKTPRGLAVPAVRDRILQTSVTLVLTPRVEAELEDSAFAYRQGRGVRQAVERIGYYQRQGYRWIVDADIESFFDNIPHTNLLARVQAIAPEPALLNLLMLWLTAPIQEGAKRTTPTRGIPQGSPISPMLANLYLDTLDDALLDANHVLVRYADDFIVLAKSRERAEAALDLSREVLERLSLRLNPLKTRIVHFDEGLEFLGWHFVKSLAVPKRWKEELPTASQPTRASTDTDNPSIAIQHEDDEYSDAEYENNEIAEKAMAQAFAEASSETPGWQPESDSSLATDDRSRDEKAVTPNEEDASLPPLAPLLRTLYLVDQNARLSVNNQRLQVERDGRIVLSLPAPNVDQIILFGRIQATSEVMHLAARHDCSIAWLSKLGRYYGRFEPCEGRHVVRLQEQFARHADEAFGVGIARTIVAAKLHNSAVVLARSQRHHSGTMQHGKVRKRLKEIEASLAKADSGDSLRGSEGAGAALYWQAFAELVPEPWGFTRRQRRPSPDPVNALLSLGYTILHHGVAGLLRARGLNAHLGYLHAPSGSHMALASDLMETFRAPVVDATVLALLHGRRLDPADHVIRDGRCALGQATVRNFVRALEDRFNAVVQHPQIGTTMDMRRIIDYDVRALIAAIRDNDAATFRATRWR